MIAFATGTLSKNSDYNANVLEVQAKINTIIADLLLLEQQVDSIIRLNGTDQIAQLENTINELTQLESSCRIALSEQEQSQVISFPFSSSTVHEQYSDSSSYFTDPKTSTSFTSDEQLSINSNTGFLELGESSSTSVSSTISGTLNGAPIVYSAPGTYSLYGRVPASSLVEVLACITIIPVGVVNTIKFRNVSFFPFDIISVTNNSTPGSPATLHGYNTELADAFGTIEIGIPEALYTKLQVNLKFNKCKTANFTESAMDDFIAAMNTVKYSMLSDNTQNAIWKIYHLHLKDVAVYKNVATKKGVFVLKAGLHGRERINSPASFKILYDTPLIAGEPCVSVETILHLSHYTEEGVMIGAEKSIPLQPTDNILEASPMDSDLTGITVNFPVESLTLHSYTGASITPVINTSDRRKISFASLGGRVGPLVARYTRRQSTAMYTPVNATGSDTPSGTTSLRLDFNNLRGFPGTSGGNYTLEWLLPFSYAGTDIDTRITRYDSASNHPLPGTPTLSVAYTPGSRSIKIEYTAPTAGELATIKSVYYTLALPNLAPPLGTSGELYVYGSDNALVVNWEAFSLLKNYSYTKAYISIIMRSMREDIHKIGIQNLKLKISTFNDWVNIANVSPAAPVIPPRLPRLIEASTGAGIE